MPDSLLTLKNAGFRYDTRSRGHWIFHDVNLNVAPGEVLAILGRNGVGKSTLLNTIIGLLPLTEGEVVLGDKKLTELTASQRARHIAYLPQMENSGISYTVTEYLLMGRAPYVGLFSSPSKTDRAHVQQVIEELGLEEIARSQIDQLSGGQRQQVGIGRALVQDAPLIVLDEPTSALDLANQAKVLRKLRELRQKGYGVIFTTHNPDHAFLMEAKVALLGAHEDALAQDSSTHTPTGETSRAPARLLTGNADEVLTSHMLSHTFKAPLSVIHSPELGRKTVHITGLDKTT